jgi:hypothetical protein
MIIFPSLSSESRMGVGGCLTKLNVFCMGILPKIDDFEWGSFDIYFDKYGV